MGLYQQIKDRFILKNAREDWKMYREELTELILQRKPETVTVVGAGRCNDIDLVRLFQDSVSRVGLLDVDPDSMKEAVEALPEGLRNRVRTRTGSLTGIGEGEMEGFCDRVLSSVRALGKNLSLESVRRELKDGTDDLEKKLYRTEEEVADLLLPCRAEVLVCCGVHSQLFSMFSFFIRSLIYSLEELLPGAKELEKEMNAWVRRMDDQIVPVINRALCRAAGSFVIFGNEFMPDDPVEGAYQCIQDVREHFRPEEKHLTWEINRAEGITYDMLIQICDVRKAAAGRDAK